MNHHAIACPEYFSAVDAIRSLAHALGDKKLGVDAWKRLVLELSMDALPFATRCPGCRRLLQPIETRVSEDVGLVYANYQCPDCPEEWQATHALDTTLKYGL